MVYVIFIRPVPIVFKNSVIVPLFRKSFWITDLTATFSRLFKLPVEFSNSRISNFRKSYSIFMQILGQKNVWCIRVSTTTRGIPGSYYCSSSRRIRRRWFCGRCKDWCSVWLPPALRDEALAQGRADESEVGGRQSSRRGDPQSRPNWNLHKN